MFIKRLVVLPACLLYWFCLIPVLSKWLYQQATNNLQLRHLFYFLVGVVLGYFCMCRLIGFGYEWCKRRENEKCGQLKKEKTRLHKLGQKPKKRQQIIKLLSMKTINEDFLQNAKRTDVNSDNVNEIISL